MELVMELAGVGPKEALEALREHKEIWLAVDSLVTKPVVSGEKYIPAKPSVESAMDAEQSDRCDRGRWLQEQINAVFSVAHSKTQTQPVVSALEDLSTSVVQESVVIPVSQPLEDAVEKTTQPTLRSADLH